MPAACHRAFTRYTWCRLRTHRAKTGRAARRRAPQHQEDHVVAVPRADERGGGRLHRGQEDRVRKDTSHGPRRACPRSVEKSSPSAGRIKAGARAPAAASREVARVEPDPPSRRGGRPRRRRRRGRQHGQHRRSPRPGRAGPPHARAAHRSRPCSAQRGASDGLGSSGSSSGSRARRATPPGRRGPASDTARAAWPSPAAARARATPARTPRGAPEAEPRVERAAAPRAGGRRARRRSPPGTARRRSGRTQRTAAAVEVEAARSAGTRATARGRTARPRRRTEADGRGGRRRGGLAAQVPQRVAHAVDHHGGAPAAEVGVEPIGAPLPHGQSSASRRRATQPARAMQSPQTARCALAEGSRGDHAGHAPRKHAAAAGCRGDAARARGRR